MSNEFPKLALALRFDDTVSLATEAAYSMLLITMSITKQKKTMYTQLTSTT